MAMVMRQRARTILEKSPIIIAVRPNGIGGIEGRELHVELDIGALRIFISETEWKECNDNITKLIEDMRNAHLL
jgi:hypothetical protein